MGEDYRGKSGCLILKEPILHRGIDGFDILYGRILAANNVSDFAGQKIDHQDCEHRYG
jgi:hypothetical protein